MPKRIDWLDDIAAMASSHRWRKVSDTLRDLGYNYSPKELQEILESHRNRNSPKLNREINNETTKSDL